MKILIKILKGIGILLLIILVTVGLFYAYVNHDINNRADKAYRFLPETLRISNDSVLLSKGEHLIAIKGCNDCHAADLGGKIFLHETGLGRISAPNLTSGKGGIGKTYTTADWLMVLRHGVNKKGKALWIMPSQESTELSQEDLKAIVAYCRQVKPVDREMAPNTMGPLLKLMAYLDKIPLFPVEKIDHSKPAINDTRDMNQLQQGRYLSVSCVGCHRANFKGGDSPIPGMPHIPNITATGNPGKWNQDQFFQTLRTGKTPNGHQMDNGHMPWKMTAKYTNKEIIALYTYLRSLKS